MSETEDSDIFASCSGPRETFCKGFDCGWSWRRLPKNASALEGVLVIGYAPIGRLLQTSREALVLIRSHCRAREH